MEPTNIAPAVIVGEQVAGEAAKVRKQVNALIKGLNTSTFDLAEALHTVKAKKFYTQETFSGYVKTLELKSTKAYYLCRIVENMLVSGVPREVYEPVGIAKLRVICRLDPVEEYEGKSGAVFIKALTETAKEVEPETLKEAVDKLQGKVGDDEDVWWNVALKRSVREKVVKPAVENMRAQLGTVGTGPGGEPVDSSDGRCLELIMADWLSGAPSLESQDSTNSGNV